MSESGVDIGVIGVGSMGANHAQGYASMDGVTLGGVADADPDQATTIADRFDTTALEVDALLETVDAVSVAVPTEYHYGLTRSAVDAGVDVLVEKPFVADPANGRELIECASANDVLIQVGHVERFNPVVETVDRLLTDQDVIAAQAHRLSPPPDRSIDDSATMDLMIHDLDLLLALLDPDIRACHGVGTAAGRYAVGTLEFEDGVVASLTASRVTEEPVRRLTFSTTAYRLKADLLTQSIELHHAGRDGPTDTDGLTCREAGVVEEFTVADSDPLDEELQSFVDSVRTRTEPRVTAADGLDVVEVAKTIEADRSPDAGASEPRPITSR